MSVTLIFYLCSGKARMGSFNNPLSYYLVFWGFWIFMSFSNPFGLYSVSTQAYLLIWTNLIFFSTGYLIICKKKQPNTCFEFKSNLNFNKKIKKILIFLQILILLLIYYYYRRYNSLISLTSIADARRIRFETGTLFKSYIEYAIYTYFITSFLYLSLIINISQYVLSNKKSYSLYITLLSAVVFGLTGLGRFVFFDSLVFFLIAVEIKKSIINKKINVKVGKTSKIKYVFFIIFAIGFIIIMTAKRVGGKISNINSLFHLIIFSVEQGVVYFLGSFRAFDTFLKTKPYESIGYTFVGATLSGLDEIINKFFLLIGFSRTSINDKIASFTVPTIYIGKNQTFNAFYTGIMNFYLDGRIFGVIVFSFIFGVIAAKARNYCINKPNIFNYALLIYLTYITIAYEYRLVLDSPSTWVVLFTLLFLSILTIKKIKIKFYH